MRLFTLVIVFLCLGMSGSLYADEKVVAYGFYSNYETTDGHEYGYYISLWKYNKSFIGTMGFASGLIGDTPQGLLENVRFDEAKHKLSFTVKASTGIVLYPESGRKWAPSRNLFKFSGTLTGQEVKGTLKEFDGFNPQNEPGKYNIILPKKGLTMYKSTPKEEPYSKWKKRTDRVLKGLGPKW